MKKATKFVLIVILFVACIGVGILIKGLIDENSYENAKLYNTAVQATTDDVFNYAVDSRQGNVLASGVFNAKDPVTIPDVKGQYYQIEKREQKYTHHTETYECGDSKHPRTCTRSYNSWDSHGEEDFKSKTVIFHAREYPAGLFGVSTNRDLNCDVIVLNCDNGYSYREKSGWFGHSLGDIRWHYEVRDITFSGTILVNTSQGILSAIGGGVIEVKEEDIPTAVKEANDIYGGTLFIIIWLVIAIIVCGVLIKSQIIDDN